MFISNQRAELQREIQQPLEDRIERSRGQLANILENDKAARIEDAERLTRAAGELLALESDPEHFFSVKDAESLYKLLMNPVEPESSLDSGLRSSLPLVLLNFLASNEKLNSVFSRINPSEVEKMDVAFRSLPYSKKLVSEARRELDEQAREDAYAPLQACLYLLRVAPSSDNIEYILDYPDGEIRALGLDHLVKTDSGTERVVRYFKEAKNDFERVEAALALSKSASALSGFALAAFLTNSDFEVRADLLKVLRKDPEGQRELIKLFERDDLENNIKGRIALELRGVPEAWPALLNTIKDIPQHYDFDSIPLVAGCAYGLRACPEAQETLFKLAKCDLGAITCAALSGLAGNSQAIELFESRISFSNNTEKANSSLEALGETPGTAESLVKIAAENLKFKDVEAAGQLVNGAIRALWRQSGTGLALLGLLPLLNTESQRLTLFHSLNAHPEAKDELLFMVRNSKDPYERGLALGAIEDHSDFLDESLALYFEDGLCVQTGLVAQYSRLIESEADFGTKLLAAYLKAKGSS